MPLAWIKNRNKTSPFIQSQISGLAFMLLVSIGVYAFNAVSYLKPMHTITGLFLEKRKENVTVELSGAFNHKGVYFVPEGMTVAELLRYQGIESNAKLSPDLGLKIVVSGMSIIKEKDGRILITDMKAAKRLALDLPININKAALEDLILIPGVKDATAKKLLDYRTSAGGRIGHMEDLMNIPGIKEKRLSHLRKYLYAAGNQYESQVKSDAK